MADKQSLNATFFAFRKRDKAVLLPATLTFLLIAVVGGGLFAFLNWHAFADYINWAASMGASAGKDPTLSPGMMMPPQSVMQMGSAYLLFLLAYYILLASYEAACLRWMVRGETEGLFGLSLGADTWRVYFTYWIWFFLLIVFYIVCAIVAGGAVVSMMAAGQAGATKPDASMIVVPLVIALLIVLALIFFAVRFAPAAATSIARRRFAFFDAWTVTKGRFWAMLGAFVLVMLMFVVFYFVSATVMAVAIGSMAAGQVAHSTEPQTPEAAFAMLGSPQYIAILGGFIALMTVASLTVYVTLFGINARAAALAIEEGKIKTAS